jgi:glycosyl transferase family 25
MKTFIITLLESPLSVKLSSEGIESAKKYDIDVTIWPATNGLIDGDRKLQEYNIKDFLLFKNAPGVVGCFLSHFELWNKCIEINESILILEHDAYFVRSLPSDICSKFSDVVRLDAFETLDPEYDEKIINSSFNAVEYFYQKPSGTYTAGDFYNGAHGYIIKPHAAQKLISFALTVGALPADVHIGSDLVDIKTTTVTIVRSNPYFSGDKKHTDSSTARLIDFLKK